MKKLFALVLCLMLLASAVAAAADSTDQPSSGPISHGTINKVTYLHWGRSEAFPTLTMVGPGTEFDVYEYNKDWVMVLYETWVSQGMSGGSLQSFYCFVKRADITCDPELEGDESEKYDTGPGKRKGKKPKTKPSAAPSAAATPEGTASIESAAPEPSTEVSEDEEYDWIIRTPGLCNVTLQVDQVTVTCSFALMAQKAGGTAPSSDPAFNHGMHTPYAAMASFGIVAPMQSVIENIGMSAFLTGSGGVEIIGQTGGSTFYIDTGAMDFSLVSFTLNMDATATLNPKVVDVQGITGSFEMTMNQQLPLPVQLTKAGGGYKFVLVGMRPGGGNLEFPAVLEKTFADPDRWDREAAEADRRRNEAEEMQKKMQEQLKEQLEDRYSEQQEESGDSEKTDPLAPLVTEDPLAPLVTEDSLAPLVTEDPLAPLTPQEGEEVSDFPSGR